MIDTLSVAKSAYFFRQQKRITDKAIRDLFRAIREQTSNPSRNIFRHDRSLLGGARWSALSFFYDRDPSFLSPSPETKERICGFLMLVEHAGKVALFRSGVDLPQSFKTKYLARIANADVESALAHSTAVFEKIRLRNMSTSKYALRSKMLEADDLQNTVGPAGFSRYVPQSYTLRRADGYFSTTPSTGRISHRSDRAGYQELVEWSISVIDELGRGHVGISPFIKTFARPIDLASMAATLVPIYFAVNSAGLVDDLLDNTDLRLVRRDGGGFTVPNDLEASAVIRALDVNLQVQTTNGRANLVSLTTGQNLGRISIGKNRIALRALELPDLSSYFVESTACPLGEDDERVSLRSFIDNNDQFIVLFEDLALAYISGALYRDEQLAAGAHNLLRYIQVDANLRGSISEKGTLVTTQVKFDTDCVFDVVASNISHLDDVLLCDDLGDEWADFIGLNTTGNPKTISFYHAKHGDISLGASPFHISVSQAIKNLGRLSLPEEDLDRKIASWSQPYVNFGVTSSIARVMRGNVAGLRDVLIETRSTPDAVRRVFIVTSSLSKRQVEQTLEQIQAGVPPPPHFIQLYWLLLSYFSACSEVGAFGGIICQE